MLKFPAKGEPGKNLKNHTPIFASYGKKNCAADARGTSLDSYGSCMGGVWVGWGSHYWGVPGISQISKM